MSDQSTVRLSISIQIDEKDDDCDTGVTVKRWNAMTDAERRDLYMEIWNGMASRDNGGMEVLTPGAVEI